MAWRTFMTVNSISSIELALREKIKICIYTYFIPMKKWKIIYKRNWTLITENINGIFHHQKNIPFLGLTNSCLFNSTVFWKRHVFALQMKYPTKHSNAMFFGPLNLSCIYLLSNTNLCYIYLLNNTSVIFFFKVFSMKLIRHNSYIQICRSLYRNINNKF